MRSAKIKMTKQPASFAGLPCLSGTFFNFHFSLFILHSLRPLPTGKLGGQKNATKSRATGGVSNPHFQPARLAVGLPCHHGRHRSEYGGSPPVSPARDRWCRRPSGWVGLSQHSAAQSTGLKCLTGSGLGRQCTISCGSDSPTRRSGYSQARRR